MKPEVNPNVPWNIYGYSNVDYTGYNNTQEIVTWYIVIPNGVFITWCLLIQKTVKLSITEAEYSAGTRVCFEILFMCAILLSVIFFVEYLINFHVDNIGRILLSDNISAFQCKNHIGALHHFIWDYIEDKNVYILFFMFRRKYHRSVHQEPK